MTTNKFLHFVLKRWRFALRGVEDLDRTFWEGQAAYDDLKATKYLTRVRLTRTSKYFGRGLKHRFAKAAIELICDELRDYRKNSAKVKELAAEKRDKEKWVNAESRRVCKKATSLDKSDPKLSEALFKIHRLLDRQANLINYRFEAYWKREFSMFVHPLTERGPIFQERELDGRFQTRLGAIFRTNMYKAPVAHDKTQNGPSLRTIARLIVLFLICTDIASIDRKKGEVRLKHNNRLVTVTGVLQQLQKANLK